MGIKFCKEVGVIETTECAPTILLSLRESKVWLILKRRISMWIWFDLFRSPIYSWVMFGSPEQILINGNKIDFLFLVFFF